MRDEDDMPDSPQDAAWRQDRVDLFRSFAVTLCDGSVRRVYAHYWSSDNAAGHLQFFTIEPSGRQLIKKSFNARVWDDIEETTTPEEAQRIDEIARRHNAMANGQMGMQRQNARARRDRQVH